MYEQKTIKITTRKISKKQYRDSIRQAEYYRHPSEIVAYGPNPSQPGYLEKMFSLPVPECQKLNLDDSSQLLEYCRNNIPSPEETLATWSE